MIGSSLAGGGRGGSEDARVAMIARLVGEHRNAPNLWLARRIIRELEEFQAERVKPARESQAERESSLRILGHEGGNDLEGGG